MPIPEDMTTKVLQKKYLVIELDIIRQQRVRNKDNDFSSEISSTSGSRKKRLRKHERYKAFADFPECKGVNL